MTQKTMTRRLFSTFNLTRMALLAAMASILFLIEIPIVAFYKLDLSNIPVLLGAFSMGTIPGVIILGLKSLIGWLHSTTQGVGELADFLMGAVFIIPASVIYHRNKTRQTAIIGMVVGTLCSIFMSVLVNKWIMLPFFMSITGMDMQGILGWAKVAGVDTEWKLLLMVTAPFNLLKGVVLSTVTGFIYKPLSPLLHEKGKKL